MNDETMPRYNARDAEYSVEVMNAINKAADEERARIVWQAEVDRLMREAA